MISVCFGDLASVFGFGIEFRNVLRFPPNVLQKMCRKVECTTCKKATWAGCGMHIDSALAGVPEAARCGGWKTGKCVPAPAPAKATTK